MASDTKKMSSEDKQKKIGSQATALNSDCIAVSVSKNEWLKNIDMQELCGSMTILSSYDDRIMYVPMHLAFPERVKKTTFFLSDDGETYHVNSFLSYAIVIASKSLSDIFDNIYDSVYRMKKKTTEIVNDEVDYSMSQTMKMFLKSDKCEQPDKPFNEEFIKNKSKEKNKQIESVEDSLDDDSLLFIYLTEDKLVEHCAANQPLFFNKPVKIHDGNELVPCTTAKSVYSYAPISFPENETNDGSEPDDEKDPIVERPIKLASSWAVLQDIIDFLACSLTTPETFRLSRKDLSKFLWNIKNDQLPKKDISPEVDCLKIAIKLRMRQEKVVDLTNPTSINGLLSTDPIPLHYLYLNQILGFVTAMNSQPSKVSEDSKMFTKHTSYGLPAYETLKSVSLHRSQTFVCFTMALIYRINRIMKLKNKLVERIDCETCDSKLCCVNISNSYCNKLLLKNLSTNPEKKANVNYGFEYTCLSEYPINSCFIGNTCDEQKKGADSSSEGKEGYNAQTYAPKYLLAATETAKKFKPKFKLKGDSEPHWINSLFQKIREIVNYIETESHGNSLPSRLAKHNKLEIEFKESVKPLVCYLGTIYMIIRKSAVMRLDSVVKLELGMHAKLSRHNECSKIIEGIFHGCNCENVTFTLPDVETNFLDVKPKSTSKTVHFKPVKQNVSIMSTFVKSTMKLKSLAAFFGNEDSRDSGPSRVTASLGLGDYGHSMGENSFLTPDVEHKAASILYHSVLPNLRRYSNLVDLPGTKLLRSEAKESKLKRFLANNPSICAAFASMDYTNMAMYSWEDFVDKFIIHYMLHKYNFVPTGWSNNDKKPLGKFTFFQLYEMKYRRGKLEDSGTDDDWRVKYSTDLINPDIFMSQALLMTTRINVLCFETKPSAEKDIKKVFQAKIGRSNDHTACLLTETAALKVGPISGFAVPLRSGKEINSDFSMPQLFIDMNKQPTCIEQIQLINAHAAILHNFACTRIGVENPEDLDSDAALALIEEFDPERYTMTSFIYGSMKNIFRNFFNNRDEYDINVRTLLEKAENESKGTKIEYVDDIDDEMEDDDNLFIGSAKKRKRSEFEDEGEQELPEWTSNE